MASDGSRPVVAVLGPVTVLSDDGPVAPRGARAAALVTLLTLAAPRAVSATALMDALWADDLPANPRAALQNLVSRLRALRPDVVRTAPGGYVLGGPSDLDEARAAAADARALLEQDARPMTTSPGDYLGGRVEGALGLWRGEPGDGLEESAPEVAAELRSVAGAVRAELTVLRRRAALVAGEHATVSALAAEALAADPLDEDAARDLMTALAASGRPDEAARVYGRLRHALVAELGTDPAPDLQALHERLTAPADHPLTTPRGGGRFVRGLRSAPTPLLGRDDDVRAVVDELTRHRLVTILGAGGLGKTRLAHEVARTVADGTTAGLPAGLSVAVAELAGVRTDDDVALAVADGLGVPASGTARLADRLLAGDVHDRLVERARSGPTLLVLDNCEHVPDGAARWADTLLSAAPGLRILTTSRAPLRVPAEQVYPLAPLTSAPGAAGHGPAVELFRQRALAARPGARLPDEVVARLCDRLDGLPLAIELAAARVRTLPVEDIERHLDARFALLRGGDRTLPDRHRTLEAVIEWSWNLLEEPQRALWRRVAVLPDGLSPQAAAVLGRLGDPAAPGAPVPLDVLDDVDGLVTQSLLAVEEPAAGDEAVRYRMLETVREFGLLRLTAAGEDDAVRDALLRWGKAVAAWSTSRLLGPHQVTAVHLLRQEHENLLFTLRAAARAGRPDVVVRCYVALAGGWTMRGAEERAADLAPTVLDAVTAWAVPDADVEPTALALAYAAISTAFSGITANVRALARLRRLLRDRADVVSPRTRAVVGLLLSRDARELVSLRDAEDPFLSYLAHLVASQEAENAGRLEQAVADAERAWVVARRIGDVACPAGAAMFLATTAFAAGDVSTAQHWAGVARPGLVALGADDALRQLDWVDLGAALADGDLATAERLCRQAERSGAESDRAGRGGDETRSVVLVSRAEIAWARGDRSGALDLYEQAADVFADLTTGWDDTARALDAGRPGAGGLDRSPSAPWAVLVGAAWAVRLADAGRLDQAHQVAHVVSRRAVLLYRELMRLVADHPVLGSVCLAAGAVLTATQGAAGLELLALAEVMGSRQDFQALRREPVLAAAAERHGADALAAARSRAAAVPRAELAEHALQVLEGLQPAQALRR